MASRSEPAERTRQGDLDRELLLAHDDVLVPLLQAVERLIDVVTEAG